MKMLNLARLSVLVAFALIASLAVINPALAKSDDKDTGQGGDNKVLITGVPFGDAVQVVPLGTAVGGPGNVPDSNGTVTAYAPLGKVSQVLLWDQQRGYVLLATVNPSTTWPDTVVSAASVVSAVAH